MSNCPFSSVLIFSVRCRTCFECSVMITVNGHGMNMDEPFSSIFIPFLEHFLRGLAPYWERYLLICWRCQNTTVSHILVLPFWLELLPLQVWLRFFISTRSNWYAYIGLALFLRKFFPLCLLKLFLRLSWLLLHSVLYASETSLKIVIDIAYDVFSW